MATTDISAETRARILEIAWEHVREARASAISVKDIAAAAGVSRQLIYFHYGNRAGLLVAMARHQDDRSGFRGRVAATRRLAPVAALEALLREWCAYLPELLPVARALEAALISGEDGAGAWRDRFDDLRVALRAAVKRVHSEGVLASGWTVDKATDWIWARVMPSSYEHLVRERGWSHSEYTRRTVRGLMTELLARPS
jgi:AcrR family transcriptional regulator